jgi:hypothetical protein
MTSRRTKSISTKVTPEEYARITAHAGHETISEWVRSVLLRVDAPTMSESTLLAELLALRTILLNLYFATWGGKPLAPDGMQKLITAADQAKHHQADARWREARQERAS